MYRVSVFRASIEESLGSKKKALALGFLVAALVTAGLLTARPAHAATFTVNRTDDAKDSSINDSVCDTSPTKGKQCTLRAAIEEANDTPGLDVINFKIGGTAAVKTISPTSPLPAITDPVTINGYSQPGAKVNKKTSGNNAVLKIQLDGTNAGAGANGLTITAGSSTVRGLVINRFNGDGIRLEIGGNNTIAGNFIGTDSAGTSALGNAGNGVSIDGSSDNTIGGTTAKARNVISANGAPASNDGIHITATDNKVQGNYIGTDKSGTLALGNHNDGVEVQVGSSNTTVGGEVAGAGNVISSNGNWGVALRVDANTVQGNRIGTDKSGTADLGNGSGVIFVGSSNTIGGATKKAGNTIAFNSRDGIVGLSGTGNRILSNSIFSNGVFTPSFSGLGIELSSRGSFPTEGVTANDCDNPATQQPDPDSDTGVNNLQNFPVLSSAINSGGTTTIIGTLNSTPNTTFTVQVFSSTTADPSGNGEGQTYLDQKTDVTTDANGDANFTFSISSAVPAGQVVTATATDPNGNTSEFSTALQVS